MWPNHKLNNSHEYLLMSLYGLSLLYLYAAQSVSLELWSP